MRITSLSVSLLLALVSLGCQPADSVDRLRSCGLLTDGYVSSQPFYLPNDCYDRCYGRATCEELTETLCSEDIELLLRCDQECAFRCADDTLLPIEAVCDGRMDCAGGADEADCEVARPFGEPSCEPGFTRCDGNVECTDGSDERYCDFPCGDGTTVPYWSRCNGAASCSNGADERDCARFTPCSSL